MTTSAGWPEGSRGLNLNSRAVPWKYEPLPGNSGVLAVVDIKAFRTTATTRRLEIRFNRALDVVATDIVIVRYGAVLQLGTAPLSAKMGITIERPLWSFDTANPRIGARSTVRACNGFTRTVNFGINNDDYSAQAVLTYRRSPSDPSTERFLFGPFTVAEVDTGVAGTLCY